jgi:hypothetical protein
VKAATVRPDVNSTRTGAGKIARPGIAAAVAKNPPNVTDTSAVKIAELEAKVQAFENEAKEKAKTDANWKSTCKRKSLDEAMDNSIKASAPKKGKVTPKTGISDFSTPYSSSERDSESNA